MTTLASKVNEKLYHADLLLAMLAAQSEPALSAKQKALMGAAAVTLQAAFDLFVEELADAVQISGDNLSLSGLVSILGEQGRGLPAIDNLLALQEIPLSWVSQIHRAYRQFLESERHILPRRTATIPTINLDDEIDLSISLAAFKYFVSESRAFLTEW